MSRKISVVLVHHPVLDRAGDVVTTAITNLDLHDIARSSCTYGVESFFAVHPVLAQRALAERIREHWVEGSGKKRIPDRGVALAKLCVVPSLSDVFDEVGGSAGRQGLEVWTTAAVERDGPVVSYQHGGARLREDGPPVLLLFGTGWGLAHDVVAAADLRLEPIHGARGSNYNHLSVRAACAISLDRLLRS